MTGPQRGRLNGPKEAAANCRHLWGWTGRVNRAPVTRASQARGRVSFQHQASLPTRTQEWCLPLMRKAELPLGRGFGKSPRRQADATRSPARGAAEFPVFRPSAFVALAMSGSEVLLQEVGLDPRLLSATQVSDPERGIVSTRLPACLFSSPPSLPPFFLLSFHSSFHTL